MTITAPFKFLREVKDEMAKVTWPTRSETAKLTTVVVIVSIAIGAFIGGLDYILTIVTEALISK